MRKASKILCLIGGIVGIVLAILWLVLAIVYFVYGGFAVALDSGAHSVDIPQPVYEWLVDYVKANGTSAFPNGWADVASKLFGTAALFLIMFLFSIPCAVISFILSRKEKTGLPLPIVLAVLSWAGNIFSFVGAGLAIANWAVVERKEQ